MYLNCAAKSSVVSSSSQLSSQRFLLLPLLPSVSVSDQSVERERSLAVDVGRRGGARWMDGLLPSAGKSSNSSSSSRTLFVFFETCGWSLGLESEAVLGVEDMVVDGRGVGVVVGADEIA